MKSKRKLTDAQITWAHQKWLEYYTWDEIAEALGVSSNTVKVSSYKMFGHENHRRIRPLLVYREERGKR